MRAGLLLLIAAVVLLAGATWWMVGGEESAPPSPLAQETAGRPLTDSPANGVEAGAVDGPGPSAIDGDPAASDGEDTTTREEVQAVDPGRAPQVLVVRGYPATPVAGAEVLFVTASEAPKRWRGRLPERQIEWPELCGQRTTTDGAGIARLPAGRERWLVSARAGAGGSASGSGSGAADSRSPVSGEFAFAVMPPGERMVTMVLVADEELIVAVKSRDLAGRESPARAGVPVAVLQHRGGREADVIWQGPTDAAGRAIVRHFQLARQERNGNTAENTNPNDTPERFAAMVVLAEPVPGCAEFDGRPAPSTPVPLWLPPHTGVEVLLTDHRGTPLLAPANVMLTPIRGAEAVLTFPVPRQLHSLRGDKAAGEAPVRFEQVAAGGEVQLAARFPGERRPCTASPLEIPLDPNRAGPLPMRLPLTADFAVLAGRVVQDTGAAIGNQQLTAWLWRGDAPIGNLSITTIMDGRFDVVQRPNGPPGRMMLEIQTEVDAGDNGLPGAKRRIGCRVEFPMPAGGERCELGDLVLAALPPLCSGLVVDDRGEPVGGAAITVQRREPAPAANNIRVPQGENWRDMPLLRATTDAAGQFTLEGTRPAGDLRVRADTDQHFADTVAWHGFGQQLHIRIERNGVLRGQALLPDWLPADCAQLVLQPFDEAGRQRDTRTVELSRRRGGRFVVEPLRPGRYDAIVKLRNLPEPVAVFRDVFVTPGETRDARLQPVDLRQSVFRYRLRAVDLGGRPLLIDSPLMMRWQNSEGALVTAGFRWRKGRTEFYAGSANVELVAFAPGCEPQTIQIGAGDLDIAMRQLVPAQLMLPGARQLCGPDRKVRVSVILIGNSGFPEWLSGVDQRSGESFSFPRWELGKSTGAWLDHTDLVSVPIVKDGKYEIVLRIHATASERSPQASIPLGQFDLRVDGRAMLPTTVPVDSQKVLEAIARFEQQAVPQPGTGGRPGRQPRNGPGNLGPGGR